MGIERVTAQEFDLDTGEFISGFWESIPSELFGKFELITDLSIVLVLVSITYFVALLLISFVKLIFGSRESRILKRIDANIAALVGKKAVKAKGEKEEKKESGKKKDKKK